MLFSLRKWKHTINISNYLRISWEKRNGAGKTEKEQSLYKKRVFKKCHRKNWRNQKGHSDFIRESWQRKTVNCKFGVNRESFIWEYFDDWKRNHKK